MWEHPTGCTVVGGSGKLSPVGEGYLLDRWVSGKGDGIRVKSEEMFWKFFIKKNLQILRLYKIQHKVNNCVTV